MPDHKTLLRDIRGELKKPAFGKATAMKPTVAMPDAVPAPVVVQNMPNLAEIQSGAKDLQLF
jgi:tryptophan halogenase